MRGASSLIDSAQAENRSIKRSLRKDLRRARKSIDAHTRSIADRRICAHIASLPVWRRARNVATFLAFDGEPSLAALQVQRPGITRRFHVPIIKAGRMHFAPLKPGNELLSNSFGILEPRGRSRTQTRRLDLVLVSLVGFDSAGFRLGMGGGYYDRHFAFLKSHGQYVRPRLLGVAYSVQQVPSLPHDPWDVPLWGIVTETGFNRF